MYDDPAADQPPSASADPVDGAVAAAPEHVRSQLPGWERTTTDPVCPFLRASTAGDALGEPIETPDPANRCTALHDAVPQSLRQQELVCLSSAHVNCPRYLRGAVGLPAPVEPVAAARRVTPATAGALALFGLAFVISVGFVVATGGLTLTAAVPTATPGGAVLGEIETAPPTALPTPEPTAEPTPAPTPSPSPVPVAEPDPDGGPDADRDGRTDHQSHAATDLEPLRAVEALPGHARLLHLHRSLGRQPVQHREVLRRPAQDGPGDEPVDQERPRGRERAEDPDAHSLGSVAGARQDASRSSSVVRHTARRSPNGADMTASLNWRGPSVNGSAGGPIKRDRVASMRGIGPRRLLRPAVPKDKTGTHIWWRLGHSARSVDATARACAARLRRPPRARRDRP